MASRCWPPPNREPDVCWPSPAIQHGGGRWPGYGKEHKQFWRQVILWLAKKEDTEKSGVWIKLVQRQYTPGRPVEFFAGAMSAEGEPIRDAEFEASALLPDGNHRPVHLTRQGNQMIGQFKQTELSGDYTLSVAATVAGAAVGQSHARFTVYDQDLELENSTPRPPLMANLANTTKAAGGRAVVPEELGKALPGNSSQAARFGNRGRNKTHAVGHALVFSVCRRLAER